MEFKKIKLPFKIKKPVLALGSQSKNTVCFAKDNLALLSPIHPDLNTPSDLLSFEKTAKYFLKKRPKVVAFDLHPEYQSTKYAQRLSAIPCLPAGRSYQLSAVQHHHAHIVSCMAENGLKNQKVIGVAFDGTGLGTDNTLWGAEFFICNYNIFQRKAHLKEIPLLGGEKAILEPWRLTAAWLFMLYKEEFLNQEVSFVKKIDQEKWRLLKKMYLSGLNSPLASSMGRLFDAAASLILEKFNAHFEAELAMELEKLATSCKLQAASYKFKIIKNKDRYILDPILIFKEIVADLKAREPKEKIAYQFHLTVAQMIQKICLILRKENKIKEVILSGGVFQNKLSLNLSLDLLNSEDFIVYAHKDLACNDSGISLGQAVIANSRS